MQSTDTDMHVIRDLILGLDKKVDALDKRVEVNAVRTEEQLKAVQDQLADIKIQVRSQDNRFWALVVGVVLALFGLLAKLAFFPDLKA